MDSQRHFSKGREIIQSRDLAGGRVLAAYGSSKCVWDFFLFQNGNFYLTTLCWGFLLQIKSAALLYWQIETETDLSNKLFPHKAVEMEQIIRSITSCLMGGSCFEKGEDPSPKFTSMNNTYEVLTICCAGSANGIISPILLKFTNKAIVLETKRGSF